MNAAKKGEAFCLPSFLETPFCWVLFLFTIAIFSFDIWSIFISAPHCDEDLFMNVSWRIAKTSNWLSAIQSKENFIGGTNYPLFVTALAFGTKILGDSRTHLRFFAFLLSCCGLIFGLLGLQRLRFPKSSRELEKDLEGEPLITGIHQKVAFICLSLLSYSFFFASKCLRPECVAIFVLGVLFWLFTLGHKPVIQSIAVLYCSLAVPWSGLHFVVPAGILIFFAWLFFRFPFRLVVISALGMLMGMAVFFLVYSMFGLLDSYRFQMVSYGVEFRPIYNFISFVCDFPKNAQRLAAALLPLPLAIIGMFLFSRISFKKALSGRQHTVVCISLYAVITFLCMNSLRGQTGGGLDRFVLHLPLVVAIICYFPKTFWEDKSRGVLKSLWLVFVFLFVSLRLVTLCPEVMGQSRVGEKEYVAWATRLTRNDDVLLASRPIGLYKHVQETFFSTDIFGSPSWRQFQSVAPQLNSPMEKRITLAILDNGAMGTATARALPEYTSAQWVEVGEPLIGSCFPKWSTTTNQMVYRAYRRDTSVH